MDRTQLVDSLDFDDHSFINDQVDPKACIELPSLIENGKCHLPSGRQSAQCQFMGEAMFIGAFQKTRAKQPVNFQPCIYNLPRGFLSAPVNRLVIFVCFVVRAFATVCTWRYYALAGINSSGAGFALMKASSASQRSLRRSRRG